VPNIGATAGAQSMRDNVMQSSLVRVVGTNGSHPGRLIPAHLF
jgi:hypothetical protein